MKNKIIITVEFIEAIENADQYIGYVESVNGSDRNKIVVQGKSIGDCISEIGISMQVMELKKIPL